MGCLQWLATWNAEKSYHTFLTSCLIPSIAFHLDETHYHQLKPHPSELPSRALAYQESSHMSCVFMVLCLHVFRLLLTLNFLPELLSK